MNKRWPGVFFSSIPPKKSFNNKDVKFLNERRFYLEKFWRRLAREEYIIETEEFKTFVRPNGEIKALLAKMPKPTAEELCEKYRTTFGINEKEYDLEDINKFKNIIEEFTYFKKKVIDMLKKFKVVIESSKQNMNISIANYKILMNLLTVYENLNLLSYTDDNKEKSIITDEEFVQSGATDELI